MHKKMRLVPANDNRVPSSFETIEHEEDALDLALGAVIGAEINTVGRCQCTVLDTVPGRGSDD